MGYGFLCSLWAWCRRTKTIDHVVLQCLIHQPPHGLHDLMVLDNWIAVQHLPQDLVRPSSGIACSRHIYIGVVLRAHPVHSESHIQCNANRGCNNIPSFLQRTALIARSFCEVCTWHNLHTLATTPFCCDRKARAACAQSFTLWQQATIEFTCHDHYYCFFVLYMWCCSLHTSRSWWITHSIQPNSEVATVLTPLWSVGNCDTSSRCICINIVFCPCYLIL